jgi:hypothetical protein
VKVPLRVCRLLKRKEIPECSVVDTKLFAIDPAPTFLRVLYPDPETT